MNKDIDYCLYCDSEQQMDYSYRTPVCDGCGEYNE